MVQHFLFVYLCLFRTFQLLDRHNMDFDEYTRKQWNSAIVENSADEAIGKRVWKNIDRRRFRYRTIWKLLAGAIATAACLTAFGMFLWSNRNAAQKELVPQQIVYLAEVNDCLELPDGSRVWLDAGSSVTYPEDMTNSRVVSLSGNAVFDVTKKESGQSFIVKLYDSYIEVKGTSFSVNWSGDDIVYVTLYSGAVDFVAETTGQKVSLTPSNRLAFSPETSTISMAPFFNGISWKDGNYVLENASLGDIVEFICWNWSINVTTGPSIGNGQRVNGKIMHSETPGSVLDKLCFMLDLDYDKSGDNYLIHK